MGQSYESSTATRTWAVDLLDLAKVIHYTIPVECVPTRSVGGPNERFAYFVRAETDSTAIGHQSRTIGSRRRWRETHKCSLAIFAKRNCWQVNLCLRVTTPLFIFIFIRTAAFNVHIFVIVVRRCSSFAARILDRSDKVRFRNSLSRKCEWSSTEKRSMLECGMDIG